MNIPAPIDISSIDTTSSIGKAAAIVFIVGAAICYIGQIVQSGKDDRTEDRGEDGGLSVWGVFTFVVFILMLGAAVTFVWSMISDSSAKDRAVNQLIEETTGLTFVNEDDKPDGSSIPFTDEDGATVRYFVTIDNDRVFFDTP